MLEKYVFSGHQFGLQPLDEQGLACNVLLLDRDDSKSDSRIETIVAFGQATLHVIESGQALVAACEGVQRADNGILDLLSHEIVLLATAGGLKATDNMTTSYGMEPFAFPPGDGRWHFMELYHLPHQLHRTDKPGGIHSDTTFLDPTSDGTLLYTKRPGSVVLPAVKEEMKNGAPLQLRATEFFDGREVLKRIQRDPRLAGVNLLSLTARYSFEQFTEDIVRGLPGRKTYSDDCKPVVPYAEHPLIIQSEYGNSIRLSWKSLTSFVGMSEEDSRKLIATLRIITDEILADPDLPRYIFEQKNIGSFVRSSDLSVHQRLRDPYFDSCVIRITTHTPVDDGETHRHYREFVKPFLDVLYDEFWNPRSLTVELSREFEALCNKLGYPNIELDIKRVAEIERRQAIMQANPYRM